MALLPTWKGEKNISTALFSCVAVNFSMIFAQRTRWSAKSPMIELKKKRYESWIRLDDYCPVAEMEIETT